MPALDLRVLLQKLREQDFEVQQLPSGHLKAVPPDKTRPIVHFTGSKMSEARSLKNIIADLKRSGFVWEYQPKSKRTLEVVPTPPVSSTEMRRPETFGQALRRLRQEEEMETSLVAGLLDVTTQAVGAWELDHNTPVTEHYELLLELFPALALAPRPDSRDLPKPDGGRGLPRDGFSMPVAVPEPAPEPIAEPTPEPLPQETYANMNQPATNTTLISTATAKTTIIQTIKLAVQVRENLDPEVCSLLRAARDLGMSINDVLEMLT